MFFASDTQLYRSSRKLTMCLIIEFEVSGFRGMKDVPAEAQASGLD